MDRNFAPKSFGARLSCMLAVDFRRLFKSRLFYILAAIALLTPILILVMTSMMDGMETVNQQTGQVQVIEGFDNVWQIIGTLSGDGMSGMMGAMGGNTGTDAMAGMSLTAMCNINLLYFGIAVLVTLFVSADFRSGYVKNLFTVRAQKTDYVTSKTVTLTAASALMLLLFFIGSMLGGAIAGLPFAMEGFHVPNLVLCLFSKLALIAVFLPIYLTMSVIGKQRTWLSILLSLGTGMLMFAMIPMLTPLDASVMHLGLCIAGGAMFAAGLGAVSGLILKKTALV